MDPGILEVSVMTRWLPQVFSPVKKVEFQPSLPRELPCSNTGSLLEGSVAFLPFQKYLRAGKAAQWASEWAISGTEQNSALSKATKSSGSRVCCCGFFFSFFFFYVLIVFFQIWNRLSSMPNLMTHSLTARMKQQAHCDAKSKPSWAAKQCHSWVTGIWISPKFAAEVSSDVGCRAFGELTTATALWPKKWWFYCHCSCWTVQSHGKHPEELFLGLFFP